MSYAVKELFLTLQGEGAQTGRTRRQYWERQGSQWKIFYEGVL